jgi:thymidylate synthase (FAD)
MDNSKITKDPLNDSKSRIELIDSMGNDLSIVNDARASFEKTSDSLDEKDVKLINYLIKHEHTSPFRGVVFKFKVKAPLYVCRQW